MRRIPASLVCAIVGVLAITAALYLPREMSRTVSNSQNSNAASNKSFALAIAQKTYARIVDFNGSGQTEEGSAVRIGKNLLLTCYHILPPGSTAFHEHYPVEILAVHQFYDLAIIGTDQELSETVELATQVEIGEELVSFSNAAGEDGFMKRYHISKIVGPYLEFQESAFPGESGSGLFNVKGELVGIFHKQFTAGLDREGRIPTYSRATSFVGIREFMQHIADEK